MNYLTKKIKIAIIGASGYTGRELMRLLLDHPNTQIIYLSSRTHQTKKLETVFSNLKGKKEDDELNFCHPDAIDFKKCDLVFFATPHGQCMGQVKKALDYCKVIDLSADFRIKNIDLWQKVYGQKHQASNLISSSVYGLTEINKDQIKNANLIANPGCYPTSILLPLLPLAKNNLISGEIIADCKSGTSGAGIKTDLAFNLSEIGNNFRFYSAFNHRHIPEISEQLEQSGLKNNLRFSAQLLPIPRGMMSTIYLKKSKKFNASEFLTDFYSKSIFVDIIDNPASVDIKSVLGTNRAQIAVFEKNEQLLIVSTIDNLIKGASGQAVQNMNIAFGLKEQTGLTSQAIYP